MKKALNTEFLRYRTMKSCGSGSGEVEKFNKFDL